MARLFIFINSKRKFKYSFGIKKLKFYCVFDCCKQSLTRLYHLSIHPSIHSFLREKGAKPNYWIYLLLLCANSILKPVLFILKSKTVKKVNILLFNSKWRHYDSRSFPIQPRYFGPIWSFHTSDLWTIRPPRMIFCVFASRESNCV